MGSESKTLKMVHHYASICGPHCQYGGAHACHVRPYPDVEEDTA
jgi:hypothetical protein